MNSQAPERLLEIQRRFAAHLRDPDNNPPPAGVEDRRLAIYRRLFFNNLSNLFARNFPVTRKLHADKEWRHLIRDFMIQHRSSTPMFTEIGSEFVSFLAGRVVERSDSMPWLVELAHWEYLETCVRLAEDAVILDSGSESLSAERLLNCRIRINPTLEMAQYQWPVHRISPDNLPDQPKSVVLAVYRRASDRVAFMQINALTAALLESLGGDDAPVLTDALARLAEQLNQQVDEFHRAATALVTTLIDREVILGPE